MNQTNTLILDFEKNIVEIEAKLEGLKLLAQNEDVDISQETQRLKQKLERQMRQTYANLTPWQKLQVSRHPQRPHCLDYINSLVEDFTPLSGDRFFGDDEAMIGGIGRFRDMSVVVIGQEKGHDLESRMKYNFGMAKPEGYRKAQRLMDMAEKFNMPVIAFVDTDGAFPGIDLAFGCLSGCSSLYWQLPVGQEAPLQCRNKLPAGHPEPLGSKLRNIHHSYAKLPCKSGIDLVSGVTACL